MDNWLPQPIMMAFTPLQVGSTAFIFGALLYLIGYGTVLISLQYFTSVSPERPLMEGPYRVSRNPMWVGLFLVFIGAAIATAVGLHILLVFGVAVAYHNQILAEEEVCIKGFGETYEAYMDRVPRYFLFL